MKLLEGKHSRVLAWGRHNCNQGSGMVARAPRRDAPRLAAPCDGRSALRLAPPSSTVSTVPIPTEAASSMPSTPSSSLYAGKKAVVVGAGPAGSTAAMFLAREGFTVDVYEKRPEPNQDMVDSGRAYIIILIPRGKAALEELGIALPTDPHYLTQGTVRHTPKGVSINREEGNVTWSRSDLAQFLITEAKQRYPNSINFHFNKEVEAVDLEGKSVTFSTPAAARMQAGAPSSVGHETMQTGYDLLVGADGAASKVRDVLASKLPEFKVDVSDSGREYKVYLNLQGDIEPPEFANKPGATLHLWTAKDDPFMSFTAHRNPDGSYSGTFSMRTGQHATVRSAADYEELLRTKFFGVPKEWIPLIAEQVTGGVASPAGKRIRCSQLGAPNVLMVGDAAHAVTPVFGQGANSSLESAAVLGSALRACQGDLSAVPAKFDALRKPDAHGLYEIDRKAFSFFRRRGPLDPDFLQLLSHVILGTVLSKIVPFLYGSKPKLLELGSAPYSEILAAVKRDSLGAAIIVAGLVAAGVTKAFALW